jgi:hypothetical protein
MEWTELTRFKQEAGTVEPIWLVAMERIVGYSHLRLTTDKGKWTFPGSTQACGPDGAIGLGLAAEALLLQESPPACLIGRLGGSTASYLGGPAPAPPAEAEQEPKAKPPWAIFPVGRHCVLAFPAKEFGPLFLGFNLRSRPIEVTEAFELVVSGASFT